MNPPRRSELHRVPDRGSHDWDTISQILDAGFLAHVGFCVAGQPFVIPTLYGRDGKKLYLHGSSASRMLRGLETGIRACVTITLVDGFGSGAVCLQSFHELSLRRCIRNCAKDRGSGTEDQILARHLRTSHSRPVERCPKTQQEGIESDRGAGILDRGSFIKSAKWTSCRRRVRLQVPRMDRSITARD